MCENDAGSAFPAAGNAGEEESVKKAFNAGPSVKQQRERENVGRIGVTVKPSYQG